MRKLSQHYRDLCSNLALFRPESIESFMCPTCLEIFPWQHKHRGSYMITRAHILPQAAGGREFTFACKKCNSLFGSKQDRWFGDYLNLVNTDKKRLGDAYKISTYELNGIRINGSLQETENGDLLVDIDPKRNNPSTLEKIHRTGSQPHTISFQLPIDQHKIEIYVGALTAAYLNWFKYFGYSWALQSHLDIVRDQILNPKKEILPNNFIARIDEFAWKEPWLGVIEIKGMLCLAYGVEDLLVFLPPWDQEDFYGNLPNLKAGDNPGRIEAFHFSDIRYESAIVLGYEFRQIIVPDDIKDWKVVPQFFRFPGGGKPIKKETVFSFPNSEPSENLVATHQIKKRVSHPPEYVSLNKE